MSLLRRSIVMFPLALGACITEQDVLQNSTFLGTPPGWVGTFDNLAGIGIQRFGTHSGGISAYLSAQAQVPANAVLRQTVTSSEYRGKRVRLSAWVKPVQLSSTVAGIWMRVDGEFRTLAFDNMSTRPVLGSGDWRQVSVVLNVPTEAIGISFGALLTGNGTIVVDDVVLEVVGNDVPITDLLTAPGVADTVSRAPQYVSARDFPINMGFEGTAQITDQTIAWIARNAVPLTTTDPTAALTDVTPFGQLVGSAHVVGLGEGTHGTREFALQKHRFIRYLVESKGFTNLAVEGSQPDAELINRYVLTGQGDPVRLLSGLRFWNTNTQEMLDLVKWMRQWNTTAAPAQRVQFHGFDMQNPTGALDSVETYITRVDAANVAFVRARLLCFDPYKSYGATYGAPIAAYGARLASSRAACALGLKEVYDLIVAQAVAYTARSSAAEYDYALHSARLAQQWEAFATNFNTTNTAAASFSRDSSMAENVKWLRARAGADAKFVLWAHNDHVQRSGSAMGRHIARTNPGDYVAVGFAFGDGVLNAVNGGSVQPVRPEAVPSFWLEATFRRAKPTNFLLDMRPVSASDAASAPLLGPGTMRSIGSTFDVSAPSGFSRIYYFPDDFDLLVYVNTARETTLLPYVF